LNVVTDDQHLDVGNVLWRTSKRCDGDAMRVGRRTVERDSSEPIRDARREALAFGRRRRRSAAINALFRRVRAARCVVGVVVERRLLRGTDHGDEFAPRRFVDAEPPIVCGRRSNGFNAIANVTMNCFESTCRT
jgi:hypothetical protein